MNSQTPSSPQTPVKKVLVKRVKVMVKRPVSAAPAAVRAPTVAPTANQLPPTAIPSSTPKPSTRSSFAERSSRIGQVIDGIQVKPLSFDLPDDILEDMDKYKKIPQKILILYIYARTYAEQVAQRNGREFPPMLIEMPEDTLDLKELVEDIDEEFYNAILSDFLELAPFIKGMRRITSSQAPLEKLVQEELRRLEDQDMTYADQIILAYLSVMIDMVKVKTRMDMQDIDDEMEEIVDEIKEMEEEEKDVKDKIVAMIERKHFPVDARKLVNNYFNLARKDPDKAFETLTTNPLFFSPIQLDLLPKKLFGLVKPSAKDAMAINKQMASFFKKLKV